MACQSQIHLQQLPKQCHSHHSLHHNPVYPNNSIPTNMWSQSWQKHHEAIIFFTKHKPQDKQCIALTLKTKP
jgi:hypothetical protein